MRVEVEVEVGNPHKKGGRESAQARQEPLSSRLHFPAKPLTRFISSSGSQAAAESLGALQKYQAEVKALEEQRDAGNAMLDQRDKEVKGLLKSVQVKET